MIISLFLVSVAVISYQLLLLTCLSITQWHHSASMIISVALLGFGASGTLLTIFRDKLRSNKDFIGFLFLFLTAFFMVVSFKLSQLKMFSFDSCLVFSSPLAMSKLLLTYLLFFLPFFFAASYIGLIFTSSSQQIGNLYFINLIGSGIGGIFSLIILYYLSVQRAIGVVALLPLVSAGITAFQCQKNEFYELFKHKIWATLILLTALTTVSIVSPPRLYLSEFKNISKVTNMLQTEIVAESTSPHGLLQVVRSPFIRYAPGLSLSYTGDSNIEEVIFNNGNWVGPLYDSDNAIDESFKAGKSSDVSWLDYATLSLPYIVKNRQKVLVLESASGETIKLSLRHQTENITAVESNAALINFLKSYQRDSSIYNHPRVEAVKQDPYAFLLATDEKFDLIHLPLYDAFGGTAGINAAAEKPLLTKESFQRMWESLNDEGTITISVWIDNPLRLPLRILTTMTDLLEDNGISEIDRHLVAIRNWSLLTVTVNKAQIDDSFADKVRSFCDEMSFDMLLLPGLQRDEMEKYHTLSDKSLFELTEIIVSGNRSSPFQSNNGSFVDGIDTVDNRQSLHKSYLFKIEPPTENKPFPFQFLKLSKIKELLSSYTRFDIPYLEVGYFLILATLILALFLAALFILLPLFISLRGGTDRLKTAIYFSALGMGFMFVEIVLIQQFIPYLGNPLYSSAIIISGILFFSGLGSNCSSHPFFNTGQVPGKRSFTSHQLIVCLIVLLLTAYTFTLKPLLLKTIHLRLPIKIFLTIAFISPLAFLLGLPFPLGIADINRRNNQANISWAWGINGSMSVISSILATILAIEMGFTAVTLIAVGCYVFALLTLFNKGQENV